MLSLAWRHSGKDPYRTYHMLDDSYRPVGDSEASPLPPAYPGRVKSFVYACALVAEEDDIEKVRVMSGAGAARRMGA